MKKTLKRSSISLVLALGTVAAFALPATAGPPIAVVSCLGAMVNVAAYEEVPPGDPPGTKDKAYAKKKRDDAAGTPGAGLYLVGTGPARTFSWVLTTLPGGCTLHVDANPSIDAPVTLVANGLGLGWAGASMGSSGKGEFDILAGPKAGIVISVTEIHWIGAGTLLFVNFKHDATLTGAMGNIDTLGVTNDDLRGTGNGRAIVSATPLVPGPCAAVAGPTGSPLPASPKAPKTGLTCFNVDIVAVLLG